VWYVENEKGDKRHEVTANTYIEAKQKGRVIFPNEDIVVFPQSIAGFRLIY
jgi:hypothetical protein